MTPNQSLQPTAGSHDAVIRVYDDAGNEIETRLPFRSRRSGKNGRIRSIGSPSSNNKLEDTIAWWVPKALGLKPRQAVSIEALFSSA